jgi:hypothetical protein
MIEDKVNRMLEAKKINKSANVASNPLIVRPKLSNSRGTPQSKYINGNTSSGQIYMQPR